MIFMKAPSSVGHTLGQSQGTTEPTTAAQHACACVNVACPTARGLALEVGVDECLELEQLGACPIRFHLQPRVLAAGLEI